MSAYQPKTGTPCSCRRGIERDNCQHCEGTGQQIDFAAIHAERRAKNQILREWKREGDKLIKVS